MLFYGLLFLGILDLLITCCHVRLNIFLDKRRAVNLSHNKEKWSRASEINLEDSRSGDLFDWGWGGGIVGDSTKTVKKLIRMVFNNLYVKGYVRWKLRLLGKTPSHRIRLVVLKYLYGMKIGKNTVIYGWSELRSPWLISIGDNSIIGDEAKLDGRYGIKIGSNVNFSTGVWIWTEQHDVNDPYFSGERGTVEIDDRCWISCRVTILPNVHIENGCVMAAGAVVTKDCNEYGVYGGVPAKRIAERNRNLLYTFSGDHLHFF